MAKNVLRITPRVSRVIRAIEVAVQSAHDKSIEEQNSPESRMRAVFNYGDFRFLDEDDNTTVVYFDDVEIMFTLLDDPEFFLVDYHYCGRVWLEKSRLHDGGVHYSMKGIEIKLAPNNEFPEGALVVKLADDGKIVVAPHE